MACLALHSKGVIAGSVLWPAAAAAPAATAELLLLLL